MIIAIGNQKGGVGKTTTAVSLATGLKSQGFNTLLIDLDPQCNATDTYHAQIDGVATLYDVLCESEPTENAIQATEIGNIIACDPALAKAEKLLDGVGRESRLKECLESIKLQYDYIILDTPPTLGILLVNALTAADRLIVPVYADRYSLYGLTQLSETLTTIYKYTNPDLLVAGLLLVKYNSRTRLSRDMTESLAQLAQTMKTEVLKTRIRESTATKEAQAMRQSIFDYAGKSTTAQDYKMLIDELREKGI